MGFVKEFREFAVRGSVIDLAVGVIIGGAFQRIVDSAVSDLLMPLLGKIIGGIDFKDLYLPLAGQAAGLPIEEAKEAGAVFAYGAFLNQVIQFVLLAFAVFLLVKALNRVRASVAAESEPAPAAPEPSGEEKLLAEIRDLLAKK